MSDKQPGYFQKNKIVTFLLLGVAAGTGGLFMFTHAHKGAPASRVTPPPQSVHSLAGGAATPQYNQDVAASNKEQAKQAAANGDSFVPTPIGNASQAFSGTSWKGFGIQPAQPPKPAPVQVASIAPQRQQPMEMPTAPSAYAQEVKSILEANTPQPPSAITVAKVDEVPSGTGANSATSSAHASMPAAGTPAPNLVGAGHVSYMVFDMAANSDVPGPVLAHIPAGKLAGARLIGSFQRKGTRLEVDFSTMTFNGTSYSIKAVAVDPAAKLPAMATNVDYHTLSRYGSLLGAAFLSALNGYGQAVANSGTTTVQSLGTSAAITSNPTLSARQDAIIAGAQAANTVSQAVASSIQQGWNQPPTVTIAPGTGAGLLFLSPVSAK